MAILEAPDLPENVGQLDVITGPFRAPIIPKDCDCDADMGMCCRKYSYPHSSQYKQHCDQYDGRPVRSLCCAACSSSQIVKYRRGRTTRPPWNWRLLTTTTVTTSATSTPQLFPH